MNLSPVHKHQLFFFFGLLQYKIGIKGTTNAVMDKYFRETKFVAISTTVGSERGKKNQL